MSKNKVRKQKHSFWNMHLTSTISISLVLFLIGITCLMVLSVHSMSTRVRENINLSIVLNDAITPDYVNRIERYLQSSPYAKSVVYIPKEDALKELVESLGEDPQEFLGYNPLLASLEVKLNAAYANTDSVAMIESKLSTFDHINRVVYQRDMVDLVNKNVTKISILLLGVALVLLLISMALINNTMRLAIYSNRFLINTMKLVGATPWFIRKPYIRQGIRNGFIAGILAIIYLAVMIYYVKDQFGLGGMELSVHTLTAVCCIIMATGILITGGASYFAVGRYLRMNTNDMYFV